MAERLVLTLLTPLDRVRNWLLRATQQWVRPFIRSRELRVAVWGLALISAALIGAVWMPLLLLAIGPILFGVPHILSDVRYLVVRPGLHRDTRLLPAALLLIGAGCTASVTLGLLAAGAAVIAVGTGVRRSLALALIALLLAGTLAIRPYGRIVFAHAHNLIALGLWVAWRPPKRSLRILPIGLFAIGVWVIASGAADGSMHSTWLPHSLSTAAHTAVLAPGASEPWAGRWVALFAFAQSVHYAVWLRLIPEDDRCRETPRTWRASYVALRDDFGRRALYATALSAALLVAWAIVDLAEAREGYLRLVVFHGHLEVVAIGVLLTGSQLRRE